MKYPDLCRKLTLANPPPTHHGVGEAIIWYESHRPIAVDWSGLQAQFRQQYLCTGNTREHLFHAWRSFHFDENTEIIDSYVTCTGQVAALLGFHEPYHLEVFKNTLPARLYWLSFPQKI